MFIYRKAADRGYQIEELTDAEKNIAQVYIAKHRNGPVGRVDLYFDEDTVSFKNLAKGDYELPPEMEE
jgi:replicative DNA helicase